MVMEVSRATINRIHDAVSRAGKTLEVECKYTQPIAKDQFSRLITYLKSLKDDTLKEHIHDETF